MFLFDTTILSENMNMSLSVPAVLLWFFDVQHTSIVHVFDVRARLSIFDLRLLSNQRTILIGRGPYLGEVLVWMQIWKFFTPMNHVKQLSQCEYFVSRNETPIENVEKNEFCFPGPKYEGGWGKFWNYKISSLYHCRHGPVRFFTFEFS